VRQRSVTASSTSLGGCCLHCCSSYNHRPRLWQWMVMIMNYCCWWSKASGGIGTANDATTSCCCRCCSISWPQLMMLPDGLDLVRLRGLPLPLFVLDAFPPPPPLRSSRCCLRRLFADVAVVATSISVRPSDSEGMRTRSADTNKKKKRKKRDDESLVNIFCFC